ncbi:hypothetical protein NUW58_g7103 [Xylaria curta]|uniref:Uncharacterized protein n=1 Tax=Xylaria curta TaxID=42375 RepID=A0ACC1NLN4_9PEZI|nr:hypothetical protein NUW58_g7103 [Xylaria curta]
MGDRHGHRRRRLSRLRHNGTPAVLWTWPRQFETRATAFPIVPWLSPRPVSRTKNNTELNWDHLHGAAVYEPLLKPDGSWVVREHHYIENHFARAGLSGPPLHIHRLQDEFFKVERGVLAVVKNGVEHRLTKDDGVLTIPAGTRHRFWVHESTPENVIFDVWLDPCKEVH